MADKLLDTKGLNCPLPVLKARRAIRDMSVGQVLEIEATDPGTVQDFEAFCEATGHTLLESREAAGIYVFVIQITGAPR